MKRVYNLALILAVLLLMPLASASLAISTPSSIYSLGDEANVSVTISSGSQISDFLIVSLVCPAGSQELYKSPVKLSAGEQKTLSFSAAFNKILTQNLLGQCHFKAEYNHESIESRKFEISSDVSLSMDSVSTVFNPGEIINVTGTATKKNTRPLEGYAFISIPELSISSISSVQAGKFAFSPVIPVNAKSKDYSVNIEVYDKDANAEIMNYGNMSFSFKVRQVLTGLEIALEAASIIPGSNISYQVLALDQAHENMNSELKLKVIAPFGDVKEYLISSSQSYILPTQLNSTPGEWVLEASSSNITDSKTFTIQEYPKIAIFLAGDILTITNIGNVQYNKNIEVQIGNNTINQSVNLGIGESIRRRLDAPTGEYEISVSADGQEDNLGTSFLTGRIVAVNSPKSLEIINLVPWIWTILIILLGIGAFLYYHKIAKNNGGISQTTLPTRKINVLTPVSSSKSSIMEYGQRQKCSIAVLKIKNLESAKSHGVVKDTTHRIIGLATKRKGYVEKYPNGYVFIFSPLLTKQSENSVAAVEFAKEAQRELEDHNKRFSTRIEYGLGLHEGELAVEYRGNIFNYTSTGNTIALAKKTADGAENSILLSDQVHSSTRAKVKVERKASGWKVLSVSNSDKYGDFISRFKQRNY